MIGFPKRNKGISTDIIVKTVWVSTFLAAIFALPALGLFLGIYHATGNLAVGAVAGFAVHFVTLAFSFRISRFLTKVIN